MFERFTDSANQNLVGDPHGLDSSSHIVHPHHVCAF
jgi:hypothetical protein